MTSVIGSMDASYLSEALRDCGCSDEARAQCMRLAQGRSKPQMVSLLLRERSAILAKLHVGQEHLSNIDYLIHEIKKEL